MHTHILGVWVSIVHCSKVIFPITKWFRIWRVKMETRVKLNSSYTTGINGSNSTEMSGEEMMGDWTE
jgi:hypothetical protein